MRLAPVLAATGALAAAPALAADALDDIAAIAVGDFDGDGTPDVAVGMPHLKVGSAAKAGEVRIYSGKSGARGRKVSGRGAEERRGRSLAAVGDVDGDGATDLAMGIAWDRPSGLARDLNLPCGKVEIISGRTGRVAKTVAPRNPPSASSFGDALCALGDGSGRAVVDLVARDGMCKTWHFVASATGEQGGAIADPSGFSGEPAAAGDVDGDGQCDFALGVPTEDSKGIRFAGRVLLVSGAALRAGKPSPALRQYVGRRERDMFGLSLVSAGDWDGDGVPDFLTGQSGDSADKASSFRIRVLSGKDGAEKWSAAGPAGWYSFGPVAPLADLDGDGRTEIAVGRYHHAEGAGMVVLLSGADGAVRWKVEGTPGEGLGRDLVACADADGDGVRDLVAVAPGANLDRRKGKGRVRILSGASGKVVTVMNPLE